jgi:hypothetical protein
VAVHELHRVLIPGHDKELDIIGHLLAQSRQGIVGLEPLGPDGRDVHGLEDLVEVV